MLIVNVAGLGKERPWHRDSRGRGNHDVALGPPLAHPGAMAFFPVVLSAPRPSCLTCLFPQHPRRG